MQQLRELTLSHGPVLLEVVAILVVGWTISMVLRGMLRKVMNRAGIDAMLTGFAVNLAYLVLLTLVLVTAIGKLGVGTASFVAVIGTAGLAVGLALQGSLANVAAGVMIIIFRPFKVGDCIEGGGVSGTVDALHIFATTLKTPDNKSVVVPNSAIAKGTITNYSARETRRVDMVFGVGCGDNVTEAKQTLEEVLKADDRVLDDPPWKIAVAGLADGKVSIVVRPWVKTPDYWDVLYDVAESAKLKFGTRGINITFSQ